MWFKSTSSYILLADFSLWRLHLNARISFYIYKMLHISLQGKLLLVHRANVRQVK